MNPINELKKEHKQIERELFELDCIMKDEIINYSNLVHTFRKLCIIWDHHESEEMKIFSVMEKEQIKIPVHVMTCEHRDIAGHIRGIKSAINSGKDSDVKKSFDKDLRVVVDKIRDHMNKEDEVLYTIALSEFTEEELAEMIKVIKESD
jgi:hemerythrin-like domain-containing protein